MMDSVKSRWLGAVCLLCAVQGLAYASEPVSNTLVVHRIVRKDGGAETIDSAATARPGDVLEYVADFRNDGASTARGLTATLPLPVGTEFVPGSQHPAQVQASLDGTTFAPLPLKHWVKAVDGSSHEELVPTRDYRFLRWAPADLPAHADLSVSARVTLAAAAPAIAATQRP
jgi:uncharacterized repeat protein (TIGR01451 family)